MADAPKLITSPPALDYQPYDATAEGTSDPGIAGESFAGNPGRGWEKIRDGGGASMSDGSLDSGNWDADGTTNDPGAWKQT